MYCQNCGSPNNDGARFCRQCGGQLAVFNSPASAERASVVHTTENVYPQQQIKSKKKKSKKLIAVLLIVAIIVSSVAVVAFTVDFEKLAMSDVEYYLYLEKKNAEDFIGKDFMNLFEKYSSFSAETKVTGSLEGDVLDYVGDNNYENLIKAEAEILSKSELCVKTDYNGSDIFNVDAAWKEKNGSGILDAVATFYDGQLILSSDSLTYEIYSLLKTVDSKYDLNEIKDALKKLLVSVYEKYGGFEDYATVTQFEYDGESAEKISFYFNYRFFAELADYVLDYIENDEILFHLVEKSFDVVYKIDEDEDFYQAIKDEGYDSFIEFWDKERDEFYEDIDLVEDKIEIEYEAVYNKAGDILNRELLIRSVEFDNQDVYENHVSVKRSGEKISTFTCEGVDCVELSNEGGVVSVTVVPDDDVNLSATFKCDDDVVDIDFHAVEKDLSYDYNYETQKYKKCDVFLDVNIRTEISGYDFSPDVSKFENAKVFDKKAAENIFENYERIMTKGFDD